MSESTHDIHWRGSFGQEVKPGCTDFACYDGERCIGRVYQVRPGFADEGRWFWTMTATAPPGAPLFPTNGHEDTRGAAGRKVVECGPLNPHLTRSQRVTTRSPLA